MNFQTAARIQYRRTSYYTVFLVGPNGEREQICTTQRKSGSALLDILYRPSTQERVKALPNAATSTFRKFADRLELSNGWRLEFGGTIRQEASA